MYEPRGSGEGMPVSAAESGSLRSSMDESGKLVPRQACSLAPRCKMCEQPSSMFFHAKFRTGRSVSGPMESRRSRQYVIAREERGSSKAWLGTVPCSVAASSTQGLLPA